MSAPRGDCHEILLVTEDDEVVEVARQVLGQTGLGPIRVAAPADDVDAVLANDFGDCPYLVLLDVDVAATTAADVLDRVRQRWRLQNVPVLLLASTESEDEHAHHLRLGSSGFILKPLDYDKFVGAATGFSLYWRTRLATEAGKSH